jgi:hypothetical protein
MIEVTILIIGIISILLILYFKSNYKSHTLDTFTDYYLSACPPGYKTFYNTDGDINCCDGDIIGNKCTGENQCTLNKSTESMPNCTDIILKNYSEKSKEYCSPSLSTYFENKIKNIKGCTNGPLNNSLDGPKSVNQNTCIIYKDWNDNIYNKDSCHNQIQLDMTPCFGTDCTKNIMQPGQNKPILIAIGFTDTLGIHRIAYTRKSFETYLDFSNPKWRDQGIILDKNINVVDVAKAYYIDKTIDKSEVQF